MGSGRWSCWRKSALPALPGSPEEEKAAQILKAECDAIGVPAIIEPFEIEQGIVEEATLEILEPFQQEYPVTGYQCAENTPEGGLTAEFVYVENATDVDLQDVQGKIVLVNGFMRVPLYKKLMKAGVAGIVTMEGELRDRREETDLSTPEAPPHPAHLWQRAHGTHPGAGRHGHGAQGRLQGPHGAEGPHRGAHLPQRGGHGAGHPAAPGNPLLWRPLRFRGLFQGRVRQRRGQRHQHGGAALL